DDDPSAHGVGQRQAPPGLVDRNPGGEVERATPGAQRQRAPHPGKRAPDERPARLVIRDGPFDCGEYDRSAAFPRYSTDDVTLGVDDDQRRPAFDAVLLPRREVG